MGDNVSCGQYFRSRALIWLPQWWQGRASGLSNKARVCTCTHTHTHTHTPLHPSILRQYIIYFNSSDFGGYISAFNQHYDIETYETFGNWFNIHIVTSLSPKLPPSLPSTKYLLYHHPKWSTNLLTYHSNSTAALCQCHWICDPGSKITLLSFELFTHSGHWQGQARLMGRWSLSVSRGSCPGI